MKMPEFKKVVGRKFSRRAAITHSLKKWRLAQEWHESRPKRRKAQQEKPRYYFGECACCMRWTNLDRENLQKDTCPLNEKGEHSCRGGCCKAWLGYREAYTHGAAAKHAAAIADRLEKALEALK